jgi:hypothetical protein
MNIPQALLYAATAAGLSLFVASLSLQLYKVPAYLPGPAGLPIFGMIFSMPSLLDEPWKTFQKWGHTYGMYSILLHLLIST